MINKIRKTLTLTQNSYFYSKGFTLIELLVVIAIIGILATVITVAVSSARKKARDASRQSDFKNLSTALEMYNNDNGKYPNGNWGTAQSLTSSLVPDYISKIPEDPKFTEAGWYNYSYKYWSDGSKFVLLTRRETEPHTFVNCWFEWGSGGSGGWYAVCGS